MNLLEAMEAAVRVASATAPLVNDHGEHFWTAIVGRGPDGALTLLVPVSPDDGARPSWLVASWSDAEAGEVLRALDEHRFGAAGTA